MNKRKPLLLLALLLSWLTASAQTARTFVLNSPSGARLTAFMPQHPTGRAIVDLPGGGYAFLSVGHEGTDWAQWMNQRGITYFVLEYRLPAGDRSKPLSDAYWAIATVRDSAQAWHVNAHDVGIMGFSAGGHLASSVSTHAEWSVRPDFSILFYPVITMAQGTHGGSRDNFLGADGVKNAQLVKEWSNENKVQRHLTPPAIILLANDDRTVPPVQNGVAYYSAMRWAGNDCALYIYPSGGHGFGFRSSFPYHRQMLDDLDRWLATLHAPQANALRVACIGNSITDGMGIDMSDELGYPARLQQLLGDGYLVKNFGVSARTLLNKGDYPYMREEAWHDALAFNPDIVVVKLGTNDSKDYNWKYGSEFGTDMQQMVDSLRRLPSHPTILLCTPIKAARQWTINDSTIVNGIIPAIRKVAKKNKLTVIDLHEQFQESRGMMQRDGIHPTAEGAAQMAKLIEPYVLQAKKK